MKLTLLVSGSLGLTCLQGLSGRHTLRFVFTDGGSQSIVAFCEQHNIPFFTGNPRGGRARAVLAQATCEVIISINYLFLVEDDIISLARRYAVNFHGSLLPKYRGRTPHVWAIINGEDAAGVTAHLMHLAVDAGEIIGQRVVPVAATMTGADVLQRYEAVYPELITEVLSNIHDNCVKLVPQDENQATYFPKRTPDDGAIDWQWSRERVRNWIRAQAHPYPGAFFTFAGQRYTVNEGTADRRGYNHSDTNGLVLEIGQADLVVKLANGALRIGPLPQNTLTQFSVGDQLQ